MILHIILTISFIVCSTVSYAQISGGVKIIGASASGLSAPSSVSYCNSGTTCGNPPQYCNQFCEDFEGSLSCGSGYTSNCRNVLTVARDSHDSLTFTATPLAYCPGTINTKSMQWASDLAGSLGQSYVKYGPFPGGELTTTLVQFYLTPDPLGDSTVSNSAQISGLFDLTRDDNIDVVETNLVHATDHYYLSWRYQGPSGMVNVSGFTPLYKQLTYRVEMKYIPGTGSNGSCDFFVDGISQGANVDCSNAFLPNSFRIWAYPFSGSGILKWQIDNIAISSTSEPGACQ
jgi:hypothetical protein